MGAERTWPLGQVQRKQILPKISYSICAERLGGLSEEDALVVDSPNFHLCHFLRQGYTVQAKPVRSSRHTPVALL